VTLQPVAVPKRRELNLPQLEEKLHRTFGNCREEGGILHATFGALRDLRVSVEGSQLRVETDMDPKVPPDLQAETIRRYNAFLQEATGYTAKQRASRIQKAIRKTTSEA
jgi:hypothetical protein